MTGLLRQVLDERATAVAVPRFDTDDLVARGSRRVVRRRVALAAGGVLALAVAVGLSFVVVPGSPDQEPMPVSPPGPASTDALDQYRVVPTTEKAVPLDPGPWALNGVGPATMPRVVLEIPAGYDGRGSFLFTADKPGPMRELGYWSATHVYRDPCGSNDTSRVTRVRSAQEMAAALAAQRQSRTTAPTPVSVGGYQGLSLELTTDVVPRTCVDKVFYVFATYPRPGVGGRWLGEAGQVDRYWILDVEGDVLVLNTAVEPGVTPGQLEELARIVESAEFDPSA